ncbi:[citrate (pro-3S)-lyase] ligase [Oribacterium sp. C9]|uniref:[citrate (pro-3S)-lyase] ligase n=1 Tax=Oribacterium sp. C9 TaxID=1943579 RepID=UPI00098F3778|nr:adenylyltransferase/cytidyltransferase family protein [Oribacterium sp. C9]OON86257.1 [citrate (pro-3S)-lyase] ligase [Oribacterium sp. C9]
MAEANYAISSVGKSDRYMMEQVENLLEREGIHLDKNLDYTAAMLDDDYNVIATGSCFGNTLRCMAVSSDHQGEALMNDIVSHLIEYQYSRGNYHLFMYTKCNTALFFNSLGFREIARMEEANIVFMENKRTGFKDYLENLRKESVEQLESMDGEAAKSYLEALKADENAVSECSASNNIEGIRIGAVVMNANPFTLGHRYLVEKAMEGCDILHLFMVSEDASLVPFSVRKRLIEEGTSDFKNIIYHDSGSYIISSATFPAYFQKGDNAVIKSQAGIDLHVFEGIAGKLHVNARYVGDEPTSLVTGIYNDIMAEALPKAGVECHIIPRKEFGGKAISASTVRKAIHDGDMDAIKDLVPESTYSFFISDEAKSVVERIKAESDVIHY